MMDTSKNSPGGEGVLQTFFNSLLNRKSVGGSSGAGSSTSTPIRPPASGTSAAAAASASAAAESLRARDVHAELDRIIEGNKSLNTSQSNQPEQ